MEKEEKTCWIWSVFDRRHHQCHFESTVAAYSFKTCMQQWNSRRKYRCSKFMVQYPADQNAHGHNVHVSIQVTYDGYVSARQQFEWVGDGWRGEPQWKQSISSGRHQQWRCSHQASVSCYLWISSSALFIFIYLFIIYLSYYLILFIRYLQQTSPQVWLLSSCLTARLCRCRASSRPLRPQSYSRHRCRPSRWGHALALVLFCFLLLQPRSHWLNKHVILGTIMKSNKLHPSRWVLHCWGSVAWVWISRLSHTGCMRPKIKHKVWRCI